jgi:hypothetical protein
MCLQDFEARWRFASDASQLTERCCCLCYATSITLFRMTATLRFAPRWQVWRPRLRLIRLLMRWEPDQVAL